MPICLSEQLCYTSVLQQGSSKGGEIHALCQSTPNRKIGYIIISAILCALGILLIAKPDMSLSLIGIIVGIVLIVFGVIKLIGYFSKDLYRLAFQFDLAFGILLIALSVVILIRRRT